jgi:hypothetical protein
VLYSLRLYISAFQIPRSALNATFLAVQTPDIAKMVSAAWKGLAPEERRVYQEMSDKDKLRYEVEKTMYTGPWKVPIGGKRPKDATAPKRPRSAFLAFSNTRRSMVKNHQMPPKATNGEVSKALSKMWKEAPEAVRQQYRDEEKQLRNQYKIEIAEWRRKDDERLNQREQAAMKLAVAADSASSGNDDAQVLTREEQDGDLQGVFSGESGGDTSAAAVSSVAAVPAQRLSGDYAVASGSGRKESMRIEEDLLQAYNYNRASFLTGNGNLSQFGIPSSQNAADDPRRMRQQLALFPYGSASNAVASAGAGALHSAAPVSRDYMIADDGNEVMSQSVRGTTTEGPTGGARNLGAVWAPPWGAPSNSDSTRSAGGWLSRDMVEPRPIHRLHPLGVESSYYTPNPTWSPYHSPYHQLTSNSVGERSLEPQRSDHSHLAALRSTGVAFQQTQGLLYPQGKASSICCAASKPDDMSAFFARNLLSDRVCLLVLDLWYFQKIGGGTNFPTSGLLERGKNDEQTASALLEVGLSYDPTTESTTRRIQQQQDITRAAAGIASQVLDQQQDSEYIASILHAAASNKDYRYNRKDAF